MQSSAIEIAFADRENGPPGGRTAGGNLLSHRGQPGCAQLRGGRVAPQKVISRQYPKPSGFVLGGYGIAVPVPRRREAYEGFWLWSGRGAALFRLMAAG